MRKTCSHYEHSGRTEEGRAERGEREEAGVGKMGIDSYKWFKVK